MKEIIILIVVIAVVFIPSLMIKKYLKNSGLELINLSEDMKNKIMNNEPIYSQEAIELKNAFLRNEKVWILFVDHDVMDEIENEIETCFALYSYETKEEFIASANRLRDEVEDLYKREEFCLENIL